MEKHISNQLLQKLGDVIRERRKSLDLSQEKLAERGDFDRTYISLLERGHRNPSFTNLCRVAAALQISPSDLMRNIKNPITTSKNSSVAINFIRNGEKNV